MADNFAMSRVPNVIIGLTFIWATVCILWLWTHRRGDWPKSWVLLLICSCLGSCGLSRLLHGLNISRLGLSISDWSAAGFGLLCAVLLPWAIDAISRFPTPREVEHAIRGNLVKREALAEVARITRQKENADRLSKLMVGLFKQSPALPADMKHELDQLITELHNDPVSDPVSTGGQ